MAALALGRGLSRLEVSRTALFVCDLQERFRPLIHNMETVLNRSKLCISACKELGVPMLITEQYPKVFGQTIAELTAALPEGTPVLDKTRFSMLTPEVSEIFSAMNRDQVVIVGIEAHVCVQQTVLDLLDQGKEVHVITDAVSSQREHDRQGGLDRMQTAGAVLTTSESMLFDLLRDAKHPNFKACSGLLKTHNDISTWK